jgi:phospholipase C
MGDLAGGGIGRRDFLRGSAALVAVLALPSAMPASAWAAPRRRPDSLPFPKAPPGEDMIPQIDHIVVAMMENHTYDNYLGLLERGDGFRLDRYGRPKNACPDGNGNLIRAFHMPSTCQLDRKPSQAWDASHLSLGKRRRNDGFVLASGPVAMGYWNEDDIPFYYALARTFPVCDRFFSSCLAQTYPNRKFLMCGTAVGQISTDLSQVGKAPPPNGTIFERLDLHDISWRNYYTDLPQVLLFPPVYNDNIEKFVPIDQFHLDAAAGTLPAVSFVDPGFLNDESEENHADIRKGEAFVSRVVNAVMAGPKWSKTFLIWLYDEGGGYYDHVSPPRAIPPDDIPPEITVPPDLPGGYDRYGFRVPAVIVSPYARPHYVSHRVHDHTSVLKLIETKWNLPALTYRDANASNLLDSVNFRRPPAFLDPPTLPGPGPTPSGCIEGSPGPIPPPDAVIPARR